MSDKCRAKVTVEIFDGGTYSYRAIATNEVEITASLPQLAALGMAETLYYLWLEAIAAAQDELTPKEEE